MQFTRSVPRLLHDEHVGTISLIDRIDSVIHGYRGATPPSATDGDVAVIVKRVVSTIEADVTNHFDFEENTLFPFLAERGEHNIGLLLEEEHNLMRDVGYEIIRVGKAARDNGFTPETWTEFRRLCAEWSERMMAHVQKEEMALLPILEDMLDADADADLVARYTEAQ